jgi:membrane associated rhomboid family serine protease
MDPDEKKKVFHSLIFPSILLAVIWFIKLAEFWLKTDFSDFGIYPQHIEGLRGVLFAPLLHSGFAHLSANSVPLFVLTAGLFYFYDKIAPLIFSLLWLITGFWVWVFAKDTGIHIGASGVVYALAAFHFTGGLLRREPRMMAFSLLVVFLYGGLIWGIIPNFMPDKNISWESHLMGLLAGVILALFYRNRGPRKKEYQWDDDEEPDPDEEPPAQIDSSIYPEHQIAEESEYKTPNPVRFVYHIKKNAPDEPIDK